MLFRIRQIAGFTALAIRKLERMTLLTLGAYEQPLKWFAFVLGLCSTVCIVQGWQLAAMIIGLPFCLIWVFFGWFRTEPQLAIINVIFSVLYVYGIARYLILNT